MFQKLLVFIGDTLEKAKSSKLIYRTDLPYRKPDGSIGYRKGWVLPEDSKKMDKHKLAGGAAADMVGIRHDVDMFDDGEGDAWENESAKKKPVDPKTLEPGEAIGVDLPTAPEEFAPAVASEGSKYTPDRVDAYVELPLEQKLEAAKKALEKGDWSGVPVDPELPACGHILKMAKWCLDKAPDGSEKGFNIRGYQNHYVRTFLTEAGVNTRQDNTFQTAFGTLKFEYLKNSDSYRVSLKVDNDSTGVFGAAVDAGMTGPGAYETGVSADDAIPVGTTKTENGVTYILGLTHRWERFDDDLGADTDSVAFKNNWEVWLDANDEMINEHCQKALEKGNMQFAAFLARVLADRKTKGDTDAAQEAPVGNPELENALKDAPEIIKVKDGDGIQHYVQKDEVISTVAQGGDNAIDRVVELVGDNPDKAGEALEHLAEGMVKRGLIDGQNEAETQTEELVHIDDPGRLSTYTRSLTTKITNGDYRDYGSWSANGRNLGAVSRKALNEDVSAILLKLRDELTPDDLDKIRRYSGFGGVDIEGERGVLYDYYTSPPAAKMVWQLMNKISPVDKDASVLEPSCGTGVFFEVAPDNVELTGVEYDKRTAALDLELFDPKEYKGWKNPKLEAMANNAVEIQKKRGGGQVIFCDRVMNGAGSFNMHEKIKASLVAKGVDPADIIMVNGVTKSGGKMSESQLEKTVSEAVDGFNTGKYKYIIGTTQTLGEGVNLQKNSSALHHVDIPFRPSDFIQRNGRVDRQGNAQGSVELHTYLGKGTLDAGSVAMVQRKANWIDTMLKTKSEVFSNPDAEGNQVDMEEIMAALQEEWGDTKSAEERRRMIKEKKEAAEKAERQKMAYDGLKQLSIIRGALRTANDKPGSPEYQARLRKANTLAQSLAANPEFKHPDLLTDAAPDFIYDHKKDTVYREGDHFLDKDGRYFRIEGINHKGQNFRTKWVGGVEQRKEYRSGRRGYLDKPIDIQPQWSAKYGLTAPDDAKHIPGGVPQREVDDATLAVDEGKYKQLPLEEKARLWEKRKIWAAAQHGKMLYEEKNGEISTSRDAYGSRDENGNYLQNRPLSPFEKEDREKILAAYKNPKGPNYLRAYLERYAGFHPELDEGFKRIKEEEKTQKSLKFSGPRLIMRRG